MGAGTPWMAATLILLLVGGAATFYIRTVLLRGHEAAAGIAALSAMSWRDFIHLVLESLTRRGYHRVGGDDAPTRDGEFLLVRDGERWLMSCKHGSAYVLGEVAVNELADDLRLSSATGGLLVTQGRVAEDAHAIAKLRRIELLDGPTLWPRVRDLIPPEQLAEIRGEAQRRTTKLTFLAWLVALLVAGGALMLMPEAVSTPETDPGPANTPDPVARDVPDPAAVEIVEESTPLPDEDTLELQRKDVANAISTLPMVDRATWPTRSTLEVFLLDTESDAVASICPLMERYPGLAASRIQLTPPHGSQAPVRFRQCRVY